MNLILFEPNDFIAADEALIRDRRLRHLLEVNQILPGQTLRAGLVNAELGEAELLELSPQQARFRLRLSEPPPAKLPVTLLLALPRPKMLRRILQNCASLGVSRLILLNSYRVEKSFWQTPFLQPQAIREQLILGLEQARDSVLPEVILEKRFKPFLEDRLPELCRNSRKLLAHPGHYAPCPHAVDEPVTLAIGPEGGWIGYEVQRFTEAGFTPIQLGERILRVETAVTALLARLY